MDKINRNPLLPSEKEYLVSSSTRFKLQGDILKSLLKKLDFGLLISTNVINTDIF